MLFLVQLMKINIIIIQRINGIEWRTKVTQRFYQLVSSENKNNPQRGDIKSKLFEKLSNDELKHVLEYRWEELSLPLSYEDFEDYESINTVIKITNGNFRLVQRLFSQIIRIMEINELNKINVEVIETARDGLLIGENE